MQDMYSLLEPHLKLSATRLLLLLLGYLNLNHLRSLLQEVQVRDLANILRIMHMIPREHILTLELYDRTEEKQYQKEDGEVVLMADVCCVVDTFYSCSQLHVTENVDDGKLLATRLLFLLLLVFLSPRCRWTYESLDFVFGLYEQLK